MPDITLSRKTYLVFGDPPDPLHPAEDLYPAIELYPSNGIDGEFVGFYRIENGSMSLDQLLCADNFVIGQAPAAKFEARIFNLANVSGKKLLVYQIENDDISTRRNLFKGYVDSCKQDEYGEYRDLVAYDELQYNRDYDISAWWNTWRLSNLNPTLRQVFEAILGQVGLSYHVRNGVITDLPLCNTVVYTGFTLDQKRWGDMLCECLRLFCVSAHMDANGELELIRFNPTGITATDVTGLYDKGKSDFEGYTTAEFSALQLLDDFGTLKYVGDLTDNPYTIKTLFLSNKTQAELTTICNTLFAEIQTIRFKPMKIDMIVSDFDLKLGDYIQTDKGYHYIMSNQFSGPMLVNQIMEANADEYQTIVTESASGENFNTSTESVLEYCLADSDQNLDGTETWSEEQPAFINGKFYWVRTRNTAPNGIITYENIHPANALTEANQGVLINESAIQQNAQAITLKVSQSDYNGNTIASLINQNATTVAIQASKINLNGAVTANDYFKILNDGTFQANRGDIGDLVLENGVLTATMSFPHTYTSADLTRMSAISRGAITPTTEDYELYDIDQSGSIDAQDYYYVETAVNNNDGKIDYVVVIDPTDYRATIKILFNEDERVSIGGNTIEGITGDFSKIKMAGQSFKDFVIEQGITFEYLGGPKVWSYRKWISGTKECWYRKTATASLSAWGQGYSSGLISLPDYPFTFDEYPIVQMTAQVDNGAGWCLSEYNYSTSNAGGFYIASFSGGNKTYTINVYAVGDMQGTPL